MSSRGDVIKSSFHARHVVKVGKAPESVSPFRHKARACWLLFKIRLVTEYSATRLLGDKSGLKRARELVNSVNPHEDVGLSVSFAKVLLFDPQNRVTF